MKKQGLIAVDLDGTLIDTVAVNAESYRRALESFGFTLDYDYYAAYCNGRHYRAFLQPLMGGSPSAEDVERVHDLKKQYYAANMDIARKNEAPVCHLGSPASHPLPGRDYHRKPPERNGNAGPLSLH